MKKFNKDSSRAASKRFVADITGIIYNGLVHKVPKVRTLRTMRNELTWYKAKIGKMSILSESKIWMSCVDSYTKVSKSAFSSLRKAPGGINYQENLKNRSKAVYYALKPILIDDSNLKKTVNWSLNEIEAAEKHSIIDEMLDAAREAENYSPFFLSDSHQNCAKDHLQYESKIYYDEKYLDYVSDEQKLLAIGAYIRNHKCMSVQEVIGYPHYFLTRPNCHHQIVPVRYEEVMGESVRKMMITHKLIKTGQVKTQADFVCRAYFDKFEQLKTLWDLIPNEQLAKDMKESKMLYHKWAKLAGKR